MSFVVHLTFPAFFKALTKGSIVYSASYSLGSEPKKLFIVLTADLGVPGGAIHAVKFVIKTESDVKEDEEKSNSLAKQARQAAEQFLSAKGAAVHPNGVLLAVGLEESLDRWETGEFDFQEFLKIFESGKEVEIG
jgi:hypothetical protein